jgi:hypothetical protein
MKHPANPDDAAFSSELRRAIQALPDAPAALQRAAVGLWSVAAPAPNPAAVLRSMLNRIVAVLAIDSWATPPPALAMRSLRSPTRHLLFSAQGRDIDLRIAPAHEAFSVLGQILGPDESGSVEARQQDQAALVQITQLDAMGEFRLDGLAPGSYVLTFRVGVDEIVLPAVEVGAPAQ